MINEILTAILAQDLSRAKQLYQRMENAGNLPGSIEYSISEDRYQVPILERSLSREQFTALRVYYPGLVTWKEV
jgi:hypothetical protein